MGASVAASSAILRYFGSRTARSYDRGMRLAGKRAAKKNKLKKLVDRETPRAGIWDRVIKETGAPGIYYEDYPELSGFNCPEWSHLLRWRLVVPHLRKAL